MDVGSDITGWSCVRVLGLHIDRSLKWCRDSDCPVVPQDPMTRRGVHGLIGKLLGHYSVAGWLRIASAVIQRATAQLKIGWEDKVDDRAMGLLHDIQRKLCSEGDPVKGRWPVKPGVPITVWAVASSLSKFDY